MMIMMMIIIISLDGGRAFVGSAFVVASTVMRHVDSSRQCMGVVLISYFSPLAVLLFLCVFFPGISRLWPVRGGVLYVLSRFNRTRVLVGAFLSRPLGKSCLKFSLVSCVADLTPAEQQLLVEIRRRKTELLQEIQVKRLLSFALVCLHCASRFPVRDPGRVRALFLSFYFLPAALLRGPNRESPEITHSGTPGRAGVRAGVGNRTALNEMLSIVLDNVMTQPKQTRCFIARRTALFKSKQEFFFCADGGSFERRFLSGRRFFAFWPV